MKNYLSKFSVAMFVACMCFVFCACSKDDDVKDSNSIVGTWTLDVSDEDFSDVYTLVFKSDNSGYVQNDYGTKASVTEKMYFDWSLSNTSDGRQRLSVIYTSGDKDILPFEGNYAQWNSIVTVAGNTLSIQTSDNTVMLFKRL